ncbi:DUF2254 domain-containing protein [Roseomonas sp. HJA6]|uniref:DUF2254 domain-containing protein n=1 Tax=Roseomonas alba TaxID=2846776 RepID=A0ABS7A8I7_9PROT|nr:DUF2254 domain-containing protein [Neoroseomonas alba]MBW6398602.1 DUF2254 domain-containing protein [Neoroseomonas alba]
MRTRLYAIMEWVGDVFWAVPALLSLAGVLLAELALRTEAPGIGPLPPALVFADDVSGARNLLGIIAGSAITVASTIFSITIAALSLTSGQMGPRLLRNFLRDTGNKWALGLFLLTFAYCLELQRGMGAPDTATVPHLGLTLAVGLALLCTATLAWFVQHVASGINVETVIGFVQQELMAACERLTLDEPAPGGLQLAGLPPPGAPVRGAATGYLRAIDHDLLADWAAERDATLSVLARPGDFLHPAARIAEVRPSHLAADAAAAMQSAMILGPRPAAAQDLEFAVRQLVEVAVRALSPGINDPFTAIAVLDRLGAALCALAGRHLPPAVLLRQDVVVLYRRGTSYAGLCDAMFHMIRQAGAAHAAVLIRMIEVIDEALDVETDPSRREHLLRHVRLALVAGQSGIGDAAGRRDLDRRATAVLVTS